MESTLCSNMPDPHSAEAESLATAVRDHARGMWRYLRLMGCAEHEVEDLCQDAFVVALDKGFGDRDRHEIGSFLRRTAANLYLRHNRRNRRRAELLAAATEQLWQRHCADDHGEALLAILRGCVGRLTGRAREVVDLVYRQGLGRADAAHAVGMKANGMKSMLQRIRRSLRECVDRRVKA